MKGPLGHIAVSRRWLALGARTTLTMDVRRHGLMGIVFTLHEQQELFPRSYVCDYTVEYLQRSGPGGRKDRQEQTLTKGRIHQGSCTFSHILINIFPFIFYQRKW